MIFALAMILAAFDMYRMTLDVCSGSLLDSENDQGERKNFIEKEVAWWKILQRCLSWHYSMYGQQPQ